MKDEHTHHQDWDFEAYDRQLDNLLKMCNILLDGWNDYNTSELDCDLRSLRTKAAKVCYLAEQDMAMQMNDVTRLRQCRNEQYYVAFTSLVYQDFVPLMRQVVNGIHNRERLEGRNLPTYTTSMSKLCLHLLNEMPSEFSIEQFIPLDQLKIFDELDTISSSILDQVNLNQPGRLWYLMQIFLLLYNLHLHFKKMMEICKQELSAEEKQRRLQAFVKQVAQTSYAQSELQHYYNTLVFNNDGRPLDAQQLRCARREIHQVVPQAYHNAFVSHIQNLQELAEDIYSIEASEEDYIDLTLAIAKWQMLTREINRLENNPQEDKQLCNMVFHTMRHNKPVDLGSIRTAIEKAIKLVEKKNQWICVWCVLNHFGYIEDTSMEQFARQMMSPQWFGGSLQEEKTFKGDTLRDYNGYFTMYDYTQWDKTTYLNYKEKYNKKKWGDTLWSKFQQRCYQMEEVMRKDLTSM